MQKFFLFNFIPTCCPICAEVSFSVVVYHVGLNGSVPDCSAHCQYPGGLPPRMTLGCGLTSVRGNRGENYE